ncbi:8-amino-7-oxononanoate synthase [Vibrio aestuarianus]|uniref:8-amino-7-oxononanoate synthase n=1 Tax=Vibrio aestuarianus TaxID=28171 RepID=A0A9X4IZF2_9VIBR|nr:8-amino-7-oxononanoate synthase [Vibrio aestuarianus]MDE1234239.1 8-amino-7-oxononanoate synthase [Vibrio aestuarianus]MDE1245089.1 8-amino-7-oxononanoate synthase [Vibrio aestuarianus]MDE1345482.1 8-amino-7-oxononanoate synthase [Vibrio aestuarianus]NGZ62325.1 8-amino-7-oxononanoate synthase [Vibrio aestuarianus subsp. cardii]
MLAFNSRVSAALTQRREMGLSRSLVTVEAGNQAQLIKDGVNYLNFSSNDYLGLASDAELIQAWQHGLTLYGCGSAASPLVTGFSSAHQNLEAKLCEWLGYERAILFGSGFSANQAMLFSLLEQGDLLLQDKLNHASLMEAGMLCGATMKRFKHNDLNHLRQLLDNDSDTLVVTEGVFSMDGDRAPLSDIDTALQGKAWLAVDDAHGIGVLGDGGAGSCNAAGIKPQLLVVTFGKAFGLSGAAILCNQAVGDFLTQFARHHVYSTAMPPAQAYALTHAISMVTQQEWRRKKLSELQAHYASRMKGFSGYVDTQTPIKPFVIGDALKAVNVAEKLRHAGCWLTAIRPPTVPQGSARLRITLTANHSIQQVEQLTTQLQRALEEHR